MIKQAIKSETLTLEGALGYVKRLDRKTTEKSLGNPLLEEEDLERNLFYRKLGLMLRPYFKKYDTNGDGMLDFDEFRVICNEVSHQSSKPQQLAMFNRMDIDGNGTLCFDEFVDCMLGRKRGYRSAV